MILTKGQVALLITVVALITLVYFADSTYIDGLLVGLSAAYISIKAKALSSIALIAERSVGFALASKVSFLTYLKTMTILKAIILAVKRFLIDNVFSRWLEKNIISHITPSIQKFIKYYKSVNLKLKVKKTMYAIIPASIVVFLLNWAGVLKGFAIYGEIKAIVIGFFKLVWAIGGKVLVPFFTMISNSWLAPIIEIFALSWILGIIERKVPIVGPFISNFIKRAVRLISVVFESFSDFIYRHAGKKVNVFFGSNTKRFNGFLIGKIEKSQVKNEVNAIKEFQKILNSGGIHSYHEETGASGSEFYSMVNKKTNDHVDIAAYTNHDTWEEVLIIQGIASHDESGTDSGRIVKEDFWVLNNTNEPVQLLSQDNTVKPTRINPGKVRLIKGRGKVDFSGLYIISKDQKYRFEILETKSQEGV